MQSLLLGKLRAHILPSNAVDRNGTARAATFLELFERLRTLCVSPWREIMRKQSTIAIAGAVAMTALFAFSAFARDLQSYHPSYIS